MKHLTQTALIVVLGIMIGFSTTNACDKDAKKTAAKTVKASGTCQTVDKSSVTTAHTAHQAKVVQASETKDADHCATQKTTVSAADCPVTDDCCEKEATKASNMKDGCSSDEKTTKTASKTAAPKANKSASVIKTVSDGSK